MMTASYVCLQDGKTNTTRGTEIASVGSRKNRLAEATVSSMRLGDPGKHLCGFPEQSRRWQCAAEVIRSGNASKNSKIRFATPPYNRRGNGLPTTDVSTLR